MQAYFTNFTLSPKLVSGKKIQLRTEVVMDTTVAYFLLVTVRHPVKAWQVHSRFR